MDIQSVKEMVHRVDKIPGIMVPRVGRWAAWPIFKPVIFHEIRKKILPSHNATKEISKWETNVRRVLRLCAQTAVGVRQILRQTDWRDKTQLIVLTHSNSCSERLEDGRYVDIFFDELLVSGKLAFPAFVVESPSNWGHVSPTLGPRHLFEELLMLASIMLARSPEVRKSVQDSSRELACLLGEARLPLNSDDMKAWTHKALASFEAKRRIYKRFFRHRSCKGIFVLNWIGVMGKVAAAKEMNIPVFDFQHGGMEKGSVGYHWDGSLKAVKANMPLPDMVLVYGQLWREALIHEGFWSKDEIVAAGSARMDRFRKRRDEFAARVHNGKVSVLFTTQWTTRVDAISFWNQLLGCVKSDSGVEIRLIVKVHPFEKGALDDYRFLEKRYPNLCKVLFDEDDTYSLMLKSDIHVSYYSTSLLESLALGIPSVSICRGKAAPDGIAGIRPIPRLRDSIVHVGSVKALFEQIGDNIPGSANMEKWRCQTMEYGKELFTPGFIVNASRAINRKIAGYEFQKTTRVCG